MDGPFRRVFLHGQPQLLEPNGGLVQFPPGKDVGQARGFYLYGQPARVLGEEPEPAGHFGTAGGRRQFTAKYLEQAGFAGTVAAHQADLVTGAQAERRTRQHGAPAYLHAQFVGLEHPSMMAVATRVLRRINSPPFRWTAPSCYFKYAR